MIKKKKVRLMSGLLASYLLGVANLALAAGSGVTFPETGLPDPTGGIAQILTSLLNWMLGIVGIVAIISFVISGLQYFMAVGDKNEVESAKKTMQYSIYGIIVALAGVIVVQAVDFALRAQSF